MKPIVTQPERKERRRDNGCAVCGTPIGNGWLMCTPDWRKVPRHLQVEVTATWGRFQRRRNSVNGVALLSDYRKARDAAIASVTTDLSTTTNRGSA